MKDESLEYRMMAVGTAFEGIRLVMEAVRESIDSGDLNGALVNLNMGLSSRIEHLQVEATAVDERLRELGGVYPPPEAAGTA